MDALEQIRAGLGLAARAPPHLRLAGPEIAMPGATAAGLRRSSSGAERRPWSAMSDQDRDKPKLEPGDQAPPGTPGTGENVCPDCGGSGKVNAQTCPTCGGTGKVVEGVGGG
jgi:hypothetical protein